MPIKNQPHCLCYEFNYQINRNNFDRGIFLDAVDNFFLWGAEMKTGADYSKFYPKQRSGKECKKTNCSQHKEYVQWQPGNSNLEFCMNCKHSHVSQYSAADKKDGDI